MNGTLAPAARPCPAARRAAPQAPHPPQRILKVLWPALGLLLALISGAAAAHGPYHGGYPARPGVRIGVTVGPGWWVYPPYWYYPSYYYPAPVVVLPSAPTTYIERGDEDTVGSRPDGYWYYCEDARTYYPYLKDCPGGWTRVTPTAPPR